MFQRGRRYPIKSKEAKIVLNRASDMLNMNAVDLFGLRSQMRKLLILGIILLAVSIPFFCFAWAIQYEDVTISYDEVNPLRDGVAGHESWQDYPFGDMHYLEVKPYKLTMNPVFECLYVTCAPTSSPQPYTVLGNEITLGVFDYTNSSQIGLTNSDSSDIIIEVFIAADFEGTYATAVFLHHYETPNWIFLGFDVILIGLILAVLAITLLLRQKKP